MSDLRKCAIVGVGNVGATAAYTLAKSGIFTELVLIDTNIRKAEGEAIDISHGLPFMSPARIYAGDYPDTAGAAVIIIAAGTGQREGESRRSLLSRNAAIFSSVIGGIIKYNTEAVILVVSNPVDVLTYTALRISGFPPQRVIGSGTVLDTARLKYLVGREFGVDSRNVHAFIIGEHGDSELAVFSSANISGIDIGDFCMLTEGDASLCSASRLRTIYEDVRDSAYKIISAKGATYYAIAEAILRIVECIMRDENSVLPVSVLSEGHYGIDGVCIGLPAVIGRGGVKRILDIPLDETEHKKLIASSVELHGMCADIDSLIGITVP